MKVNRLEQVRQALTTAGMGPPRHRVLLHGLGDPRFPPARLGPPTPLGAPRRSRVQGSENA